MGTAEHTERQDDSARYDDCGPSARAHMRVVRGASHGMAMEIPKAGLTIGRTDGGRSDVGDGAELLLDDRRMSRRHVRVQRGMLGWSLVDTDSRNGGYVYGRPFEPGREVTLVDGAVVRLGDSLFVFRASSPVPADDDDALFPGQSPRAAATRDRLRGLVTATGHVLIQGETGTGKEHAARFIAGGATVPGPLVPLNCAELSRELARSELFGHLRGAFSGAQTTKLGLIDAAGSGVLFLDEIAELPLDVQGELLRFLEDGTYRRVGSTELRQSAARIVAATNADLDEAVRGGRFRRDLLARLRMSNAPVELPPLRARAEDILTWARRFAAEVGGPDELFSAGAAECLLLYPWLENLRELRGLVRSLLAERPMAPIATEKLPAPLREHRKALRVAADHLPTTAAPPDREPSREEVEGALGATEGRMVTAAQRLGIDRRKLYRLCERFGVDVEGYRRGK